MLSRPPRAARSLPAIVVGWVATALIAGCATGKVENEQARAPVQSLPALESGFLCNYSRLQPSAQSASVLFYRDEQLRRGYRKILFRPVQVWRGADRRLEDVPESDLQYLADSFYRAMTKKLGQSFELVQKPGSNVLEIQLALTLVTKPHQKVDFYSTEVPVRSLPERTKAMSDATITFVRDCALEAEFAVSEPLPAKAAGDRHQRPKRIVKLAFFDKRRGSETSKGNVNSWSDVDAVFDHWAEVMDLQLVALKDGTFQPRLAVRESPVAPATPK